MRSWAGLAVIVAGAGLLAACSVAVSGRPVAAVPDAGPPPRFAPPVPQPKDARGVDACALLTVEQVVELGFRPETAESGTSGAARTCGWRTNDPGNPAGLQVNTESTLPALDGIYLVRDEFAVFEPIEVAGHPAVHADGNPGPICTIYTAIADYQGLATDGNLAGRPLPDPCAPSRRMAELILSNLPPLR